MSEASRLLRERGLSGVSVGDLMKAADLTHGSFYNHFGSKQALVADCIDHVSGLAVERIAASRPNDAGRRTFVSQYLSLAARDDPGQACLMSSLGAEISREPTARSAMTSYVRAFIGKLVSHFPGSTRATAEGDAIRMTASMVGALVLARAVDDEALSARILREVTDGLVGKAPGPKSAHAVGNRSRSSVVDRIA